MTALVLLHCVSGANSQAKLNIFVQMMHPHCSKATKAQPSGKIQVYYLKISRVHSMPEDVKTLIYRNEDIKKKS